MPEPRRIYPAWLTKPYSANAHNLAETIGRIADRTEAEVALRNERIAALEWCRKNGNPHRAALNTPARDRADEGDE